MTRRWNGKSLVDEITARLWDTSSANQQRVLEWINEIQNDIVSELPLEHFKFQLKKLLPTSQDIISLNLQKPVISNITNVLENNPSQTYNEDYADDTGFTYTSSEAEFTGGLVRQKDMTPTDESIYISYDSSTTADRGVGTLAPTGSSGSPGITGGKLDLSGGTVKYVDYNIDNHAPAAPNTGAIRFKFTPDYNSTPSQNNYIIVICNTSNDNNKVELIHNTSGSLRVLIHDSAGTAQVSASLSWNTVVSGQEYECELNWDLTGGATRFFVDGTQLGSTNTGTGTRTLAGLDRIRIGSDRTGANQADFLINDVQIFDTVQNTANYTPTTVVAYKYCETVVTLPTFAYSGLGNVQALTALSATDTNSPKYIIDGQYWTGSAWAASNDTFAQASSASDINTNIGTLVPSDLDSIVIDVVFQDSNTVQMSATDLTLTYTGETTSNDGSLTAGTSYKVYATFLVWDDDTECYIESELSAASSEVTASASANLFVITLDTFSGDSTQSPSTIYRRIYIASKASGESSYGEPFYMGDIADNTTTTYQISSDPTSTITPPSDSEIDQLASNHPCFKSGNRFLVRQNDNALKRYDPDGSDSTTPFAYDFIGTHKIRLYPRLSSTATNAQRTLTYWVYRRPHEIFYDIDRELDLPIVFKKALVEGVVWKGYEYKDRDGQQSKLLNYENFKKQAIQKLKRQKGRPSVVRDVNGDTHNYEVV